MTDVISADGTRIHYEVVGSGDRDVLLLHGLGDSGEGWARQVPALSPTCRLVLVDVRGHGRSAKPANGDYSIAAMGADAIAAARAAGCGRAHVVGISMGGGVAFEVAIQAPELVASLVIVNSTPTAKIGGLLGKLAIGARRRMVDRMSPAEMAPKIAQRLFPDPGQEDLRAEAVRRLGDNDPQAYRAATHALLGFDRAAESRQISVPTLFIHSEHDYTPLRWRKPFVEAMPDARLVQIDGGRHAVTEDHPEEVNRLLLQHFDHVDQPA